MVAPNMPFNPFSSLTPRRSAPESSQEKSQSPSESAAKGSAAPANGAMRGSQVPDQAKTEALQPAEKGPAAPASPGSHTGAGKVAAGLMSRAEDVAVPRSKWTTPPSVTTFAPPSDDASVSYAITLYPEQAIEISLGANRGTIHKGDRLAVYRPGPNGPTHVGLVEVIEVKPDSSRCKIVPESLRTPIEKGDRVATTQVVQPTTDTSRQTEVRVFHLVNAEVSSCAEVLSVLPAVRENKVRITVDKRTNCVVAAAPKEDMLVIEALLQRLDATAQQRPGAKSEEKKATTKY